MQTFKYYKRGKGELDTSNFLEIAASGCVFVKTLDEKTFVSLLALNTFIGETSVTPGGKVAVIVDGYVAHLRGDKDVFPVAGLYSLLTHLELVPTSIQHERTDKVSQVFTCRSAILKDLPAMNGSVGFVGADKSVAKFMAQSTRCANKVREGGKVTSLTLDASGLLDYDNLVIVDDILGGGATIYDVVKKLYEANYNGKLHLWVRYNEGIHNENELRGNFDSHYIGDEI